MATAFAASSPQIATFISSFHPKSCLSFGSRSINRTHPSLLLTSSINTTLPSKKVFIFRNPTNVISQTNDRLGRIAGAPEDVVVATSDTTDQIVSNTDDGVSTVISALLFVAFIGLSILTIGVIYLGVTDFLQKREKEKFEKEEAANKSGKKKRKVKIRAGPKGFGQKIIDEDEDDD